MDDKTDDVKCKEPKTTKKQQTIFTSLKNNKKIKQSGIISIEIDMEEPDEEMKSPLESPPIASQFSNIITESEVKKGVQRNPRRLVKRPKVTYTRHKKLTEHDNDANKRASKKDMSVFDFPNEIETGGSDKRLTVEVHSDDEDVPLKKLKNKRRSRIAMPRSKKKDEDQKSQYRTYFFRAAFSRWDIVSVKSENTTRVIYSFFE